MSRALGEYPYQSRFEEIPDCKIPFASFAMSSSARTFYSAYGVIVQRVHLGYRSRCPDAPTFCMRKKTGIAEPASRANRRAGPISMIDVSRPSASKSPSGSFYISAR